MLIKTYDMLNKSNPFIYVANVSENKKIYLLSFLTLLLGSRSLAMG